MRLSHLLVILLLLQVLPLAEASSPSVVQPELRYDCSIGDDGSGRISAVFRDTRTTGLTVFWMLVPKNESEYRTAVVVGDVVGSEIGPANIPGGGGYVFYSNLTIKYRGPLEFSVNWNMSYASLIVEPDALFFSPAIGFSPGVRTEFTVTLPRSTTKTSEFSQRPVSQTGTTFVFLPVNHDRIGIAFQVSGSAQNRLIESSRFQFRVPKRYEDIGSRLLSFYENASRVLDTLFNTSLSSVKVEFFVPSALEDISTGGFVPITSAYRLGTIYLNIFYVRTEKGYMEAIAAHELVHHYLATLGIAPDVLWFHEGMANYVGIKVSELSGLGGAGLAESLIQEASALPNSNRSFVLSWKVGHSDPDYTLYQHYAAAYNLTATIAQRLSSSRDRVIEGQSFFTALFTNMRRLSTRITDNEQLTRIIYASANFSKDAFSVLMSVGLRVRPMLAVPDRTLSNLGSVGPCFLYLLLEGPVNSAVETAASRDISTALTMMNEADDFLANFNTSLLVLLLLSGVAMILVVQRRVERPRPEPIP